MSNFKGQIRVKGKFQLLIYDANDKLIEQYVDNNLVVNTGRQALAQKIGQAVATDKHVTKISFGENGADPLVTDTALINPFTQALDNVNFPTVDSVNFYFSLALEDNNGAEISEFGLLCEDNTLFARKARATIEKTDEIRLEGIWTITFE